MKLSSFILMVIVTAIASASEIMLHVAVTDFEAKGLKQSSADIITARLRGELLKLDMFRVMERSEMKSVLGEMDFQHSGVCDHTCAVEMGEVLGVDRMITGTVGKVGSIFTINTKMIDIRTGEILLVVNEDCKCPIEKLLSESTEKIAEKLKRGVRREKFGGLKLTSEPAGAWLYLNGRKQGETPYVSNMMVPGEYMLKITMPTYATILDSVAIEKGHTYDRSFTLKHTTAYLDSIKRVRRSRRRTRLLIRQAAIGLLASGFTAGGVYMNRRMQERIDRKNDVQAEYDASTGDFDRFRDQVDGLQQEIDKYGLYRNTLYAAAGTCVAGFTVSFFF